MEKPQGCVGKLSPKTVSKLPNELLVWFGLVIYACPHCMYARELIMTTASSGKAQETFATNTNIYICKSEDEIGQSGTSLGV